jgi:excisionase family DNA binding protein
VSTSDDKQLLTVSQAAEALNASSQSIRNWIRAGRLAGVRVGNRFLIPRPEVDRMLGEASGGSGESPWAFGPDEPVPPLHRAADRRAAAEPDGAMLGG